MTPLAFRENEDVLDRENYDNSVTPKKSRSISEVYNDIDEAVIEEELCLMGIDKQGNYEKDWRDVNYDEQ